VTAQRTAATLTPGDVVPWRSLERSAFEDFPEVVEQLAPSAAGGGSNRRFLYFVPLALLVAVIYGMPIWGLVTVVGPWGLSQTSRTAQGDITVGGVIFAVALVALLVHSAVWLWSGRPAKTALLGSAGMALGLGALSAGVATMRGVENSVPSWQLWVVPMIACAVVGAIVLFLVLRVRRRAPVSELSYPVLGDQADPGRLRTIKETVGRVADEDQALIRRDLTAAIGDLEQRGVITAETAELARATELGELAARFAAQHSGVSHPHSP
jgi:hypothetical protein